MGSENNFKGNILDEYRYVALASLFKSDVTHYFESEQNFSSYYKEYERHISNNIRENRKSRTFVISFLRSNQVLPHVSLSSRFGESYSILDSEHALLFATNAQIQSLSKTSSNKYSVSIISYAPLLPQLKIDSEISEAIQNNSVNILFNTFSITERSHMRLRLLLSPFPSENHIKEFVTSSLIYSANLTSQFQNKYQIEVAIDFPNSEQAIATTKKSIVYVTLKALIDNTKLSDCNEKLISLLSSSVEFWSEKNEVQWIEVSHPVYSHNRWARGVCDTGNWQQNPLNYFNISGEGEVIGVADTGIDMNR